MPAGLEMYADSGLSKPIELVKLSDVSIDGGELGEGEPFRVFAVNTGSTGLRDISIGLGGPGADHVQLAIDDDGTPGVWAAAGESIAIAQGTLFPDDVFSFWARGTYSLDDVEDERDFQFVVRAMSVG